MVSYLQIEGLTKSFGDRMLFADVTFGVYQGDKIGIIAQNGKGKSTLLSIISGEMDYDSGNVVFRTGLKVGYLQQMPEFAGDMTVLQAVMPAVLGPEDWNIEDRAKQILSQFKINDFAQPIAQLSGGQVKRVALARVLLSEPEMLILDEPTNHLDIEMIEWMEKYLSKQNITLLMVTHDRYFLDNVCNKIIEIDREQTFTYNGNYDYYLQKREERMENLTAELAKVKNLLRTELEWMRRQPQARGSKAKYRIDNFYELEKRSQVNLSERNVELAVKGSYIGSKIFEAKDICKSYGDKVILKDWNYTFARYDKVGIVGDNGVGKSTFIKLLLGLVEPDSGHFDIGQTVKWGYYSQDGIEFDESKKVIDAVREIAEEIHIDEKTRLSASQFLSHFLFAPDTQQKFIHKLSGGEKRRLYLATVLMRNPNFLILDEPTNDLDIVTLSVLEDYLSKFKGCVIVVSHDRFFLDRIVDHLFVFKGNGVVKDFPGDYSTYRHCLDMESKMAKTEAKAESAKTAEQRKPKRDNSNKLSYKETRELEELEKRLPELETEKNELEGRMSTGEMSTDELLKASQRVSELIDEIDMVEMRMLELMEKEG
ncbi:MAG: ABC-F family ATP-binding cassette domain-containing protein [Muribaculaceae bacterium]|nr:ABC-F family ATP-binding cassette domain-containing protein [Muribaculaceae bacterium]